MHFFYMLEPDPPFRMVATSGEFCVGSQQDADDCESIQFVSGLAPRAPLEADGACPSSFAPVHLLIAYGVNDCEARPGWAHWRSSKSGNRSCRWMEPAAHVSLCRQACESLARRIGIRVAYTSIYTHYSSVKRKVLYSFSVQSTIFLSTLSLL